MLVPVTRPSPLRILIIDADRRVRESLSDLISCEAPLDTVGTVGTAADALAYVSGGPLDVIVIDPLLPDLTTGLDLIAHLRADYPATRLLVMSWATDTGDATAGDAVHLDKNASPEALVAAISSAVRTGGTR